MYINITGTYDTKRLLKTYNLHHYNWKGRMKRWEEEMRALRQFIIFSVSRYIM